MGFFQAGFEITRLPKDTTISTPMFGNQIKDNNNNNMANTNNSTAGVRVGCGSSVFQVSGSICSNRFAMSSVLSGVYVVAASRVAYGMVARSPLTVSPSAAHRPIMGLVGIVMATAFAAAVLPKPDNDRTESKSL